MSSSLTFIILGTTNFFGLVPNNTTTLPAFNLTPYINQDLITTASDSVPSLIQDPTTPAPTSVPSTNEDRMRSRAAIFGYTYSPGIGAYRVFKKKETWNSARQTCERAHGHLLIINSVAESEVVSQLLQNRTMDSWVGIHDHYEEGEFVTIHGESLVEAGYHNWEPGEPNNVKNAENCAIVKNSGKLWDINCNDTDYFICELPRV